jgi:hypothetical protein
VRGIVIALLVASAVTVTLFAQDALPARDTNPWAAQIAQLQADLAVAHADLLRRDIDVSTCKATLDSVTLSDRAVKLVDEFKRVYGGEWTWDKATNRPVPVTGKDKEQ